MQREAQSGWMQSNMQRKSSWTCGNMLIWVIQIEEFLGSITWSKSTHFIKYSVVKILNELVSIFVRKACVWRQGADSESRAHFKTFTELNQRFSSCSNGSQFLAMIWKLGLLYRWVITDIKSLIVLVCADNRNVFQYTCSGREKVCQENYPGRCCQNGIYAQNEGSCLDFLLDLYVLNSLSDSEEIWLICL